MRIPFIGQGITGRSKAVNPQRLVNLYPEIDKTSKAQIALYGTPGTILKTTIGSGESRGGLAYQSVLHVAQGSEFYTLTTAYAATLRGTLNTSSGFVSMATNGLTVLVVDGTDGWLYTIATGAWTQVTDADFPANPISCCVLDTIYVVVDGGTQAFYISTDGSTWAAADFASAEGQPDDLVGVIDDDPDLVLFGDDSVEFWYNSGAADFTFDFRAAAKVGCVGKSAFCKGDNTVFFLGSDLVVYRFNGYTPIRVSTHAVENQIAGFSTRSDCRMWTEKREGHTFVWLQFPTADRTFVYDVASELWHERVYLNQDTAAEERHRANWYAYFNEKHVVGDYASGKIYELDASTYTDNGDYMLGLGIYRHIDAQGRYVRHNELEIECEAGVGLNGSGQGSDPQIMMDYSDDDGNNWSNELWRDMGKIGEYRRRAIWQRLGLSKKGRIYRFRITDPVKRVITNANLDVTVGR